MSFRFNFKLNSKSDSDPDSESSPNEKNKMESEESEDNYERRACEMVDINSRNLESIKKQIETIKINTQDSLKKYIIQDQNSVSKQIGTNTDLVPSVYEGGFKLWECSYDLLFNFKQLCDCQEKTVLDLGCGHGVLGIYALVRGAKHVVFQDYNYEVLQQLTINNVLLNLPNRISNCEFVSGDWKHLAAAIQNDSTMGKSVSSTFDLILASEILYDTKSYPILIKLFHQLLSKSGRILIASKTSYFGVGGSVHQFKMKILKDDQFDFKIAKSFEDGMSVNRQIIQLTWKEK
ncbi:histidine protein methyltransferase 1 homolog-related [Anaeramoeba flamelloides]|uniref:protein-histidine N-methyltransferase n=1 Tax=Anaeramoeba flamelloides TaxID=1746091 RepID=A0ABQ8XGU0_9EUKA|nr:histidine protein methyltransferase 1 homolog-related [Anaeramoeba flamelloides]